MTIEAFDLGFDEFEDDERLHAETLENFPRDIRRKELLTPEEVKRRAKSAVLRWQYGITIEDYDAMYIAQNGLCAVCKSTEKLVVDHCHTTGKVRGLLCHFCNAGLGFFRDDLKVMHAAFYYLKASIVKS